MSYCREEGKDRVFFVTKEDYEKPSTALVTTKNDDDEDEEPGLIMKDGTINWNCPCLGGMAAGPCGVPFRDAFSCFHYSEADPKGSECFDTFKKMQDCMGEYPDLYPKDKDETKDPLADAPDKPPEDKLESGGAETAAEPAPEDKSAAETVPENSSASDVAPTEAVSTESAPEKAEDGKALAEVESIPEAVITDVESTEQNTVEATS